MEFQLTNDQRKYFGLDPVDKKWDTVELKKDVWIFFEKDVIKKIIQLRQRSDYYEADYDLQTNKRKLLLPKTPKGKEKLLTASGIESYQPINFSFSVRFDRRDKSPSSAFEATIRNYNSLSNREIPTACDKGMKSFNELEQWIDNYIQTSPADYVKEITRLKKAKGVTVKYKSGDLFAFPITRTTYGIGKILFPLKTLRNKLTLSPDHYLSSIMLVPVLVRLYGCEFSCDNVLTIPALEKNTLKGKELLPAYFMSDSNVLRGYYPIVGNSAVVKEDVDFPISYTLDTNMLCWGPGSITSTNTLHKTIDPHTQGIMLRNSGVSGGAATHILEKYLKGEEELYYEYDIMHSKNKKLYSEIFKGAGSSPNITYDEFCKMTNAPNAQELIHLLKV